MNERKSAGMARYEDVDSEYMQRRTLRRGAGWVLLWALGVGAVISGEYSGWNFGLAAGGFWGLVVATVAMALMYVCMVLCIAELSSALPHAGGSYSFTRNAFGPLGGFLNGVTDAIEYVLTAAVIVYFIGAYLATLLPAIPEPIWWILFYIVFVGVNILRIEANLKLALLITIMATVVLVIFYLGAIGKFDATLLTNIPDANGQTGSAFPKGIAGIFGALPYAIWFYLGIEQLPLAAEEAHDAGRDVPKALMTGIITLLVLSFLVLFLNSGIPAQFTDSAGTVFSGAEAISKTGAPIADGFKAIFGESWLTNTLIVISLVGLIASFHAIIYGYGRVIFSLSRAGYFPRWMSVTSPFHTPDRALIIGGAIGLVCAFAIKFGGTVVGPALLNMAVFAAVFSYALNMISYIQLKISRPTMPRPFVSPLGIPGAVIGTLLAVTALVACFADPAYRPGVGGVFVFVGCTLLYFLIYSRTKLVAQAPEEENALLAGALKEIDDPDQIPLSK